MNTLTERDAKLKASINAKNDEIISEQRKLKTLEKNIKIDEVALTKKESEMSEVGSIHGKIYYYVYEEYCLFYS